jgi:hypothetical protein
MIKYCILSNAHLAFTVPNPDPFGSVYFVADYDDLDDSGGSGSYIINHIYYFLDLF